MHADLPRFTGSVEHALDDKGRLVVPARFRERLGAGFFLTIARARAVPGALSRRELGRVLRQAGGCTIKDGRYRRLVRHIFAIHGGSLRAIRRAGWRSRRTCAPTPASSATSSRSVR